MKSCGYCGQDTTWHNAPEPNKKFVAGKIKSGDHVCKWGAIAMATLVVITITAALVVLASGCSSNKAEEAAEIYEMDADSPVQVGRLVKISEAVLTEGLKEIGAVDGKILEYASDTDYVLIMAFTFASHDSARQAFQKLEGDQLGADSYVMSSDTKGDYFCRLIADVIYLAYGNLDSVTTVIDDIARSTPMPAPIPTTTPVVAPTPTPTQEIESTTGTIAAFAEDWSWSKVRKQDGKYGETRVSLDLGGKTVETATLYVTASYSQLSGIANGAVYISSTQQVQPTDADHIHGNYWYGNSISAGTRVGSLSCSATGSTGSFDVTDFLNNDPSTSTFYVAVENHNAADMGIGSTSIKALLR
jgi:hypothetical protein